METLKKIRSGKILKPIRLIFMLSWFIVLTSCVVFVPVKVPGPHPPHGPHPKPFGPGPHGGPGGPGGPAGHRR